jgi:hypothetical protein
MNSNALYTAGETANRLGIKPSRVRQLAAAMHLGRKLGRDWLFTDNDIEQLRQRNQQVGRPKQERRIAND